MKPVAPNSRVSISGRAVDGRENALSRLLRHRPFRDAMLLLVAVASYIWFFNQLYVGWLEPWFSYFGFAYVRPGVFAELASWTLTLVPLAWMPRAVNRPSVLIYWLLFLVVYIPAILVPPFLALRPPLEVFIQQLLLCVGLWITGLGCKIRPITLPRPRVRSRWFWVLFALFGTALALWILTAFHGRLRLVSVTDVYEQRFGANEVIEGSLIGYGMVFLSGVVDPVLMAFGIHRRKLWPFLLGAAGQVLIYAAAANKSAVSSILFIPAMGYLLYRWRESFGLALASAMALLLGGLYFFGLSNTDTQGVIFALTSLVILRTVAVPGLLMGQYVEFFSTHPHTYMSHVRGFDKLFHYPYGTDIGHVVGLYYTGNADVNANANFWCMDGIASFGLVGLIPASIFCAMFFWALDSSAKRVDVRFSAMIVTFSALTLANASLFTTLLTGGAGILMLFFYLMPDEVHS